MELDARIAARHHFDAVQQVHEQYATQWKELTPTTIQRKSKPTVGSEAKAKSAAWAAAESAEPHSVASDVASDDKSSFVAPVDARAPAPAPSFSEPSLPICTLLYSVPVRLYHH